MLIRFFYSTVAFNIYKTGSYTSQTNKNPLIEGERKNSAETKKQILQIQKLAFILKNHQWHFMRRQI